MSGDVKTHMSQAEYARHRDVVRSTVTVWKGKGLLVLDEEGRIDVAASDRLIDARPETYRGGAAAAPATGSADDLFAAPRVEAAAPKAIEPIDPDSSNWSTAVATRVKETHLALKHKAEYEALIGALVRIEDVGRQVEADYAAIKERLLTIPGKIAAGLVGLNVAAINETLTVEIIEALGEIYEPARNTDRPVRAGGAAAASSLGLSAAGQA